jgi:hypothetical protein
LDAARALKFDIGLHEPSLPVLPWSHLHHLLKLATEKEDVAVADSFSEHFNRPI